MKLQTPLNTDGKEFFEDIIDYTDIIFLSFKNDAMKLYEIDSVDKVIKHLWDRGVTTHFRKIHEKSLLTSLLSG